MCTLQLVEIPVQQVRNLKASCELRIVIYSRRQTGLLKVRDNWVIFKGIQVSPVCPERVLGHLLLESCFYLVGICSSSYNLSSTACLVIFYG